jgi:hypothetical protein
MAFLDTLGRVLRRDPGVRADRDVDRRRLRDSWGLDDGGSASPEFPGEAPAADPAAMAAPPVTGAYDRDQWRKKLKLILEKLPESRAHWDDHIREAGALGLDTAWVERCQREEFALLVRRAVADLGVTLQEHHKLELARSLIGLPEDEAEAVLRAIAAEAEAFFGKPVEGT